MSPNVSSLRFIPTIPFIALLLLASSAYAKGPSGELYQTGNAEVPLLYKDNSGIIFIQKNLTPFRAYSWKQTKSTDYGKPFYIADLNGNGSPLFVGAGKPTFLLDNGANPVWFDSKGCDQLLLADFTADEKPDFACIRGTTVRLVTFDNQMVWELNLGKRLDTCAAEDLNGDLKADIECKYAGQKVYTRLDGSTGKVIALESPERSITSTYASKITPIQTFTKDNTPAAVKEVAYKGTPFAYLAQDLNGDGKEDLVVVTDREISIKDGAKTKEETEHISTNAKKYKRVAVAELQDVYINGFQKDDEAQNALNALNEQLASCYSSYVKKSPFAGTGRTMIQSTVDDQGKVGSLRVLYTSLADKKIVACTTDAIKKASFGPANSGKVANLNLTILYSFQSK